MTVEQIIDKSIELVAYCLVLSIFNLPFTIFGYSLLFFVAYLTDEPSDNVFFDVIIIFVFITYLVIIDYYLYMLPEDEDDEEIDKNEKKKQ